MTDKSLEMVDRMAEDISSFRKAIKEKRYNDAQNVIDSPKYKSKYRYRHWQWILNWERDKNIKKLDELYDLTTSSDYALDYLNLYFEKCLYYKDKERFNRLYAPENLKKCDDETPFFYRAIGNFLNGRPSDSEEKRLAKLFHTDRDEDFLNYLNS